MQSAIIESVVPHALSLASFKAVLFDVDGTLVDSVGGLVRSLHETFVAFGNEGVTPERIRSLVGTPLVEQMRLAVGPDAPETRVEEAVRYALGRYAANMATLSLFEPAVEALRLCKAKGLRTALVTSKNAQEIEAFTPKFSAMDAVDTIVCASDVLHPKPHADSARLACERLDVAPADAVMIGDTIYDLRCARAAGCAAVAVTYGAMPYDQLAEDQPDEIFASPEALREWVDISLLNQHAQEESSPAQRAG